MKPTTAEWIIKAEGDYLTARRELAVKDNPNHDAVTFHAQQCAEKYLKARLIEAGVPFPKTTTCAGCSI
jgi:HEPN domain-containing protein